MASLKTFDLIIEFPFIVMKYLKSCFFRNFYSSKNQLNVPNLEAKSLDRIKMTENWLEFE